ncbi:hypothetical protein AVEN_178323-1 [Araneus ventricosus]|uniref:Uncharacterized protein n=1 Tax=Araneus ventricosus TaxID=182803 RepID=A0A4Y2BED4_ARAVE|nr:hypothetical protein AVEN_178323-1 [Araneus ventricosus]
MPPLGLEMVRKFSTNETLCSLGQRHSPSYPEPTTRTCLHLGLLHQPYPTNHPPTFQLWDDIISNGMMNSLNLVLSNAKNLIQRILTDSKSNISHNGEKNIFWESEARICVNRRMDYGLIFPW